MIKKNIIEKRENNLSEGSLEVINDFLSFYGGSSRSNYKSAVYKLLLDDTQKKDVTQLTFEDFKKCISDTKDLSTQEIYKKSFLNFCMLMII
ncbi:MAG: hypothetical protein KAX49_18980 [Halanaerobiales bacterium]|nr:hypothetical protein [Halanaerobiales bacterium]